MSLFNKRKNWTIFWWPSLLSIFSIPILLSAQPATFSRPQILTEEEGLPQAFVSDILQDQKGFIWMATRDGLCRYDGQRFKVFQPNSDAKTSISFPDVLYLKADYKGRIWIRNTYNELDLFDPVRETFHSLSRQSFYQQAFSRDSLQFFCPDRQNHLWLYFHYAGLVSINLNINHIQHYKHQPATINSINKGVIKAIIEGQRGAMWFATTVGLDRYDRITGKFTHYQHQSGNPNSLPDNELNSLYQKPDGSLVIVSRWHLTLMNPTTGKCQSFPLPVSSYFDHFPQFGTDAKGTVYFYYSTGLYCFNETSGIQKLARFAGSSHYQSLLIDRSNVLWIGTNGHGVRKFDLTANQFQRYPYRANFQTDLLTNQLGASVDQFPAFNRFDLAYFFRYTFDKQNHLLFNIGKGSLYQLDLQTKKLVSLPFPPGQDGPLDEQSVPLTTSPQGTIWALCNAHLFRYSEPTQTWTPELDLSTINSTMVQLVSDDQSFWVGTESKGLFRINSRTNAIRQYAYTPTDTTSLSSNIINFLSIDRFDKNILWVGTFGSGLCRFDKRTGTCRRFTTRNGLPNNVIYSAIPDRQGNLWVATNKGICRFNRQTFQVQNYTIEDGLMANEFNRHHILQLPDDRIILGGIEGITTFNPSQVKNDTFQPRVELTGIQINNRQIEPGKGSPLGELPIHALSELSLLSNQNYLNFEFASLQYNKEKKTRYRYRMEGLDADWIVVNRPMASYTDLKPGYYTLFINASNSSGVWSKHVRTFRIKIHPPLWATWWAYTIYGLLLVALLYGIFRTYANRLQLQQSVILKQNEVELTIKEAQQLKNIDEIKTRFFTNITHEFKTPLTLIIAPTHYLINELSQTKYARQLASIEQNANQLLRLINQLLDLSKIEASAMEVHESRGNPGVFIGQILDSFTELANQKGVELTYHNQATSDYLFDASLLERIIYNLVSNALKFTPTGGNVTVQLNAANGITLVIADNGIGIPSEKIAAVFERFVQADTSSTRTHEGTGIGLALVKELVDLQQGTIRIDSEVDSLTNQHGTTITLQLPYRQVEPLTGPIDKALDIRESRSEAVPIVLLVEDNPDMATLIIDCLPTTYQFIWAKNGVVGLAQAVSQLPDLIISDVLMPEMDGYTLCQTLKADVRTNHIPLILLTAKSSVESRLEGLSVGADDYLTKPFLLPELQLRIRNLLERQKLLRELIRKSFIKIDQDDMQLTIVDPFLAKLYACIDAKLDDSAYGVEELANDIGMSRYTLHRKTKTLTTMLPNELIRNYRLKRSLSFLRKGNTVAETAVLVGFDSPSYFTKCFRNHYNITPKQLLQQAGTENNIE